MNAKDGSKPRVKKVGILKLGNIASSILLEMLLDERADREDIQVRTVSSGAKLTGTAVKEAFALLSKETFDLIVVATPNASLKTPKEVVKKIHGKGQPVIVLTDVLKKETREEFVSENIGFLVVKADAMIGARREFLDPIEMALYNSDLLKVLAIGGAFRIIYSEIDRALESIVKESREKNLPQKVITAKKAVDAADFFNPYAKAKARAALEIAEKVAKVNNEACFKLSERQEYLQQVATAHEMMQTAAKLAGEAREIEKSINKVKRQPHHYKGQIQSKRLLTEKPDNPYKD